MPRAGAKTLSDLAATSLTLVCAPCNRCGVYSVARLIAKHGDAGLPDLRGYLSADCPKRTNVNFNDRCKALFERAECRRK